MDKSYQLGQFRKPNLKEYMINMSFQFEDSLFSVGSADAVKFINKKIVISELNPLTSEKNYYLNFSIREMAESEQSISIYLRNSEDVDGDKQMLKKCHLAKGSSIIPFELIFNPVEGFNEIIFELERTADDYAYRNPDGSHGRKMDITIVKFSEMKNILSEIGVNKIQKLGIQGPPGLLMCINGEQIRVGRSGIYEMAYNIPIDFMGFAVDGDANKYFIMDYQY